MAIAGGLFAVVRGGSILRDLHKCRKTEEVKFVPLSDTIAFGRPCWSTMRFKKPSALTMGFPGFDQVDLAYPGVFSGSCLIYGRWRDSCSKWAAFLLPEYYVEISGLRLVYGFGYRTQWLYIFLHRFLMEFSAILQWVTLVATKIKYDGGLRRSRVRGHISSGSRLFWPWAKGVVPGQWIKILGFVLLIS